MKSDCGKIACEECDASCLMARDHDGPCVPSHSHLCSRYRRYDAQKTLNRVGIISLLLSMEERDR